jgi:hypothetical protein
MVGVIGQTPWWEQRRESARREEAASSMETRPVARWLDTELAPRLTGEPSPEILSSGISRDEGSATVSHSTFRKRYIYSMGINRNHLEQAIRELGLPAVISHDEREADAVLVLKTLYRRENDRVNALQQLGTPVYVLRSASVDRLREALADLYRGDIERGRMADDDRHSSLDSSRDDSGR